MSRLKADESGGQRAPGQSHAYLIPVLWIALLLAGWFLLAEWRELPQVISSAMAAIP